MILFWPCVFVVAIAKVQTAIDVTFSVLALGLSSVSFPSWINLLWLCLFVQQICGPVCSVIYLVGPHITTFQTSLVHNKPTFFFTGSRWKVVNQNFGHAAGITRRRCFPCFSSFGLNSNQFDCTIIFMWLLWLNRRERLRHNNFMFNMAGR